MKKIPKLIMEFRTIKIAIVIFLCNGFYVITGQGNATGAMMVACMTAVIGIHPDTADSWNFAKYRLIGTGIGCLGGVLYFAIALWIKNDAISHVFILPLISYLTIIVCGGFDRAITVLGGIFAILAVTLIANKDTEWIYVLERLIATLVGVSSAILVNWIIHPTKVDIFKSFFKSKDIKDR